MAEWDNIDVSVCIVVFGLVVFSVISTSIWIYILCLIAVLACKWALRLKTAKYIVVKGQGIFITGCDTGFGHDLAVRLNQLGFTVFAGCLFPDGDGAEKLRSRASSGLHVVPLDVSKDESVQEAHDYVVKHLPETGLWAIVNNAGFGMRGDVEWMTVGLYHKIMNVNFYGAVRTIRTFMYLVRKTKGHVVIVSSVRGVMPWPGWSAYHASKFALETMGDSLRLEMSKFGVKVSKIRPGRFGFATKCGGPQNLKRLRQEADEMWNDASDDVRNTYGRDYVTSNLDRSENVTLETSGSASSTNTVIDVMCDAILNESPSASYIVDGGDSWIDPDSTFARYHGYLPTFISDWILYKMTKCDRF